MAGFSAKFQARFESKTLVDVLTGPVNLSLTNNNAGDGIFDVLEEWFNTTGGTVSIGTYSGYVGVSGERLLVYSQGRGDVFFYGNVADPSALKAAVEADTTLLSDATLITVNEPTCFAAGTLIATPDSEVAVETLKAGDTVLTAAGAAVQVKWVGYQALHKVFTPAEHFAPMRIRAGALAEAVPHADLTVTPDHGMMIEGLVAHAGALVNGASIVRVPIADLPERVTYYHIETDGHDVILANGAEAETFIDNATRRRFDNYTEFAARFGESVSEMEEMDLPCVTARRQLPARVRQMLDARAMAVMADEKASA